MLSGSTRRGLIVSRKWIQASVLVMLFGFGVMGMLAYGANDGAPPVPDRVVDPSGAALFTGADIVGGQEIFLRNGPWSMARSSATAPISDLTHG